MADRKYPVIEAFIRYFDLIHGYHIVNYRCVDCGSPLIPSEYFEIHLKNQHGLDESQIKELKKKAFQSPLPGSKTAEGYWKEWSESIDKTIKEMGEERRSEREKYGQWISAKV